MMFQGRDAVVHAFGLTFFYFIIFTRFGIIFLRGRENANVCAHKHLFALLGKSGQELTG